MAVNVSKTKCIIFKPKDRKINIGDNDGVIYDNNEIGQPVIKGKITKPERIYNDDPNKNERTNKLLGVYLDKHLII